MCVWLTIICMVFMILTVRYVCVRLNYQGIPITELQLAALLGKTLLEKNAELEKKLRRLQEFAEEALAKNEVRVCVFDYIT